MPVYYPKSHFGCPQKFREEQKSLQSPYELASDFEYSFTGTLSWPCGLCIQMHDNDVCESKWLQQCSHKQMIAMITRKETGIPVSIEIDQDDVCTGKWLQQLQVKKLTWLQQMINEIDHIDESSSKSNTQKSTKLASSLGVQVVRWYTTTGWNKVVCCPKHHNQKKQMKLMRI